MTRKTFITLLTTTLCVTASLHSPLVTPTHSIEPASPPSGQPEPPFISPVDIPFNAEIDQPTVFPSEREQSDNPVGSGRVVVGPDDRVPVLNRHFPWAAIGRLEWHYNNQIISACTATLIDSALVLTNSHCLTLPNRNASTGQRRSVFVNANQYSNFRAAGRDAPKLVFKPSMIDGQSLDEATVITYAAGWSDNFSGPTEDWAVLQLDEALGDRYGYLGWRTLDLNDNSTINALSENTLLAGYSGDFPTAGLSEFGAPSETAGADLQCSMLGIWPEGELADTLVHDCDTNPGASGAPILAQFTDGEYYIIGLHARQVPLNRAITLPNGVETRAINGGVQVSRWAPTAFQMLSPGRQ